MQTATFGGVERPVIELTGKQTGHDLTLAALKGVLGDLAFEVLSESENLTGAWTYTLSTDAGNLVAHVQMGEREVIDVPFRRVLIDTRAFDEEEDAITIIPWTVDIPTAS